MENRARESALPVGHDLIIVRPAGEVALKAKRTRQRFEKTLRGNLRAALRSVGAGHVMRQDFGRLYVETDADAAQTVLPRVFGVGTFSRVEAVSAPSLEAIVEAGAKTFAGRVRGRTYAVRAKKTGGGTVSTSEVNRRLGAALNAEATVDLEAPQVTVYAEIGPERCNLFSERRQGAGGLPLGASGHAISLLSGGFDSAVAAWRMMRRGVTIDHVFCNLGGGAYERMVLHVAKILHDGWGFGHPTRLHVIDFDAPVRDLKANGRPRYTQVTLKRLMVRAASAVAAEVNADAIITGEAVGQVSSQTLSNLRSIEPAASVPVLRPLVGFDKQEIVDASQRIGTAPISKRVKEYCAITPGKPVVASTTAQLDYEEEKLDPALLAAAIAGRRVIDLGAVTAADLRMPYLFSETIPSGAAVIDCQPASLYKQWHMERAENRDPIELMDNLRGLDKDRTYIVYCAHGVTSAGVAEIMQQSGFEAYAFAGGLPALKHYLGAGA